MSPYAFAADNPMGMTDPLGLFSIRGFIKSINKIARTVGAVAGVAAVACAMTVICLPAAAVLGSVAVGAGAVTAGTSIALGLPPTPAVPRRRAFSTLFLTIPPHR